MGPSDLEIAAEEATAELFAVALEYLDGLTAQTAWRVNRSPAEALYEVAESEQAALLVVGSSHRRTDRQGPPRSTGASLLQGAPCSVLVAPREFSERDERSFERIGVAFDGSPEAWAALETAIGLAERFYCALCVVTVAEMPHYSYAAGLSVFTAREYESSEHDEKRRIQELALKRVPEGDFSAHRLPAHRRPRPPARRGGRGL